MTKINLGINNFYNKTCNFKIRTFKINSILLNNLKLIP